MKRITNEMLYREVRDIKIVLLGIEDTEENGMVGDVKDIKKHNVLQNNSIQEALKLSNSNSSWIAAFRWIVGGLVLISLAVLTNVMGVW